MKKLLVSAVAALATLVSFAQEAESFAFGYDAGADIVSAYIWRGQYNGGLSFQPTLDLGWDSEHTSFRFGTWWNVGASDWKFQKEGTFFVPELDVYGTINLWGVTLGFTHYYYFGGSKFFCWDKVEAWKTNPDWENNTSTTEVTIGYDFSTLDLCGLYFTWNTMVAGNDFAYTEEGEIDKRAYSSYLEVGYDYTWENPGITLGGAVGMVPWASDYYGTDKFAVTNLTLKLNKAWDFDACELDLYAQGSINPTGINKENAYINGTGDEKIGEQRLNGCIGLGVWF